MIRQILICVLIVIFAGIGRIGEAGQRCEVMRIDMPVTMMRGTVLAVTGKTDLKRVGRAVGAVRKGAKIANWTIDHASGISECAGPLIVIACPVILIVAVLYLLYAIFCKLFGRHCDMVRDASCHLMSVKMPKSILIVLTGFYLISLSPTLLVVLDAVACEESIDLSLLVKCLSLVMLPICLQKGGNIARLVATCFCMVVSMGIIAVCAICASEADVGMRWWVWIVAVVGAAVPIVLIGLLFLPQSNEWFSAQKELRGRKCRANDGSSAL